MSTTLKNSIWPNADGTLGENKVAIPDGITTKWPDGDALIGNFVYKDGKLVGFVDTKALIINETKSTTISYDCVNINLENILENTLTIIPGERCKSLTTVYGDVVKFLTPKLKELLGETKFELYFENDTKKLIIHTDRISDDMVVVLENLLSEVLPQTIKTEKYNHNIEVSWKNANKYAECKNLKDILAVEPVLTEACEAFGVKNGSIFTHDLTPSGDFGYPLPNMTTVGPFHHVYGGFFKYVSVDTFRISLPKCTNCYAFMRNNSYVKHVEVDAPLCTNYERAFKSTNLQTVKFTGEVVNAGCICLNSPNLYSIKGDFSKATNLNDAFGNCKLDKESALMILNSIKTWDDGETHKLTLGINVDHQNDEEVWAAIFDAETRGWTLTVQWNPGGPTYTTPAASTFAMGTLIYARASEMELPDGTTEQFLDWGHYVTKWEERGYEQFRSLESAYEHFGLEMNN